MTQIRLLLVCRRFWPIVGPAERALAHLAGALAERGCDVTVLTVRWNAHWPVESTYRGGRIVRIEPAPRGGWATHRYLRALRRWIRRYAQRFDVVSVDGNDLNASPAALAVLAAVESLGSTVRAPAVVVRLAASGPADDIVQLRRTGRGRRTLAALARAAAIVALDDRTARQWIAAGGPASNLHRIDDGVPLGPLRDESSQALARTSLAEAGPALRLHPFELLVACDAERLASPVVRDVVAGFHSVLARWPLARLWLAGDLPDRDVWDTEIQVCGLSGRVLILGAIDQPAELAAAADVVVVPWTAAEPPTALREAMAAGATVVCWDLRTQRPTSVEKLPVLWATPGDPESLGAALDRAIDDPGMSTELGRRARQFAQEQWSLEATVERYGELFGKNSGEGS